MCLRRAETMSVRSSWSSRPCEDLLLKLLTLGDDRNVKEVYVDGRCAYAA